LKNAINDSNVNVRLEAVMQCKAYRDPDIMRILMVALYDPSEKVRYEVIRGLSEFPKEQVADALVKRYFKEEVEGLRLEIRVLTLR